MPHFIEFHGRFFDILKITFAQRVNKRKAVDPKGQTLEVYFSGGPPMLLEGDEGEAFEMCLASYGKMQEERREKELEAQTKMMQQISVGAGGIVSPPGIVLPAGPG